MTENKWTEFTQKITRWKRANKGWNDPEHESYQEDLDSLERIMKKGKSDEARRGRIMTTVRTLFMDIPTSPFRTGKASSIDAGMLATYNKSRNDARTALITAWNASEFLQMYEVKSKRGGGGVFTTAEEYADYLLSSSKGGLDGPKVGGDTLKLTSVPLYTLWGLMFAKQLQPYGCYELCDVKP